MNKHVEEILKLSKEEQFEAYATIGERLMHGDGFYLTEEQKTELDRRLEMIEKGEMKFSSWEDVKKRLRNKK